MRRFRAWLRETFLPVWAKEDLLKENQRLREQYQELQRKYEQLRSYTDGLEAGVRSHRRIIINNGGAVK